MLLMEHLVNMRRCQEGKLSRQREIIAVILKGRKGIKIKKKKKGVISFISFIFHLAASSWGLTIFFYISVIIDLFYIYIIASTYTVFRHCFLKTKQILPYTKQHYILHTPYQNDVSTQLRTFHMQYNAIINSPVLTLAKDRRLHRL